jgi:hypothetical protein
MGIHAPKSDRLLGALKTAGYDGWYNLEVLSDNGLFRNSYADSLWNVAHRSGRPTAADPCPDAFWMKLLWCCRVYRITGSSSRVAAAGQA